MKHSLRRKLSVRSHGQALVLVKRRGESEEHVLQKALLWAMYLPAYPALRVEVPVPGLSRYKPDLLALDAAGDPRFWGECGVVGVEKLRHLLGRYRDTHFAFSKWSTRLDPFAALVDAAIDGTHRSAPVELVGFPEDAADWVARPGELRVDLAGVEVRRWDAAVAAPTGRRRR